MADDLSLYANLKSTHQETIVAEATAAGRAGIAIIRVSGPLTRQIIKALTRSNLTPRQAHLLPFYGEAENILDEGLALFFPAPNSFTGEDVLECHCHGGPIIVDLLLERMVQLGARLAKPGEFSLRAYLNNKLDLTQAEAIADMINASSREAARSALRSLQGAFSQAINALNEKIIYLRMYLEASIDFTDEEIDFLSDETIFVTLTSIEETLQEIESQAKQGSLLRDGITAVIIGKPNAGKSSLLNALCGKELAIVTDIPGTTRDVLRDQITIDGLPIHIADTAGLRESQDVIEQEGIRRAHLEIEKADLILHVIDASSDSESLNFETNNRTAQIVVRNKIDLINEEPCIEHHDLYTLISLSARFGNGLDLLKNHIKKLAGLENQTEHTFLARRRHLDALKSASEFIADCKTQLKATGSLELAAEDLRLAQQALGEIVGEFSTEDLLGKIFSSFCVGK